MRASHPASQTFCAALLALKTPRALLSYCYYTRNTGAPFSHHAHTLARLSPHATTNHTTQQYQHFTRTHCPLPLQACTPRVWRRAFGSLSETASAQSSACPSVPPPLWSSPPSGAFVYVMCVHLFVCVLSLSLSPFMCVCVCPAHVTCSQHRFLCVCIFTLYYSPLCRNLTLYRSVPLAIWRPQCFTAELIHLFIVFVFPV